MFDTTASTYLTRCPYCKELTGVVNVHGHYQCEHCKKNMEECCTGEQQNNLETLSKLNEVDQLDG
jgi:hypothetical protein